MAKFKTGDKVRKKTGTSFSNGDFILTVGRVAFDATVWFKETGTTLPESSLELVCAEEGDESSAVLPKEIAEALEALRAKECGCFTDTVLVNIATFLRENGKVIGSLVSNRLKVAKWLADDITANVPLRIDAVLNGYVVELSPKEELEELADNYDKQAAEAIDDGMFKLGHLQIGKAKGIREAIDLLTKRGVL